MQVESNEVLSDESIQALIAGCCYRAEEVPDGKPPADAVMVDGIVATFGFHPGRLAENRSAIGALLREFPADYFPGTGDGSSFLALCQDRHGRQWTGLHRTMEALCALAIASGQARWFFPRELWSALPGGMPYIVFTPAEVN